ncbi:MBL fold metallo-hydrolase [Pantoea sp. YR343]|uniref:MBL fold metallo-hydrolase n=1 Tax=Pantoea sp. YR343 TaxID=1144341 RepID=UPI0002714A30|nr:MBL fold metallo-hydrolase [Pantoea sp. YR343]KAJ9430784.1 MBL fold metallo-hydrolase [Pantoea sp. YR343]
MSRLKSWCVAGIRITKIPEQESTDIPVKGLFPTWTCKEFAVDDTVASAAKLNFSTETLALSTHSWLIEIDGKTILIDTASGNDKVRPANPKFHLMKSGWMEALLCAGVSPANVNAVLLTHLHVDHVGWNTVQEEERWVPTFPAAQYYLSARELDFYANPVNVRQPSKGAIEDSVIPVVEAGIASFIDDTVNEICTEFKIHRTPGHSVDHLSFSLTRGEETILFWGDVLHSPLQVIHPEFNSSFCEFPAEAARSRQSILAFAQKTNALVFTSHFPGSSAGRVIQGKKSLTWQPEQESTL